MKPFLNILAVALVATAPQLTGDSHAAIAFLTSPPTPPLQGEGSNTSPTPPLQGEGSNTPPTPHLQGEGSNTPPTPHLQGERSNTPLQGERSNTPPFPRREGGLGGLGLSVIAQTPNVRVDEASVPVALPNLADVFLKSGESLSGRVTAIDAQKLSLQRDSNSTSISLSEIEKVVFRESALVVKASGQPVIRGDGTTPAPKQAVWSGVPLNAFRVQDAIKGQAEVRLGPPVVNRLRLQGIVSVAKDRTYVVDEMQFDLQKRTMTIMATPY